MYIHFLSTTRSSHARSDQQLINWLISRQETMPFTRVEATIQTQTDSFQLAITIVRENNGFRKDIRFTGAKKRAMDVIGKLITVMLRNFKDSGSVTVACSIRGKTGGTRALYQV